ncbi:MAG: TIGR04053 family radical SAM/SPASM domain-containing protein [Actinobacteria bacterium]|nr:TIGR04053 family radical SAM/SPASM domain-containing protein [Actinomycetota bacterium]
MGDYGAGNRPVLGEASPFDHSVEPSSSPDVSGVVRHLRFNSERRPFLVLFELTRSCDLACRHCRAEAVFEQGRDELSTDEVRIVLDELAKLGAPRPIVVFTGGDPLLRSDLALLVRHGAEAGLAVAVAPAGTPRASRSGLARLRAAGATTVSFSLDGASPLVHDALRGVDGSFAWAISACRAARAAGLRLQVNTTVSTETVTDLPEILRLVAQLGASLWSIFFVVPTGRARSMAPLSSNQTEDVLRFLSEAATVVHLKTTEAPAYRRVLLQRMRGPAAAPESNPGPLYAELHHRFELLAPLLHRHGRARTSGRVLRAPLATGDGRGVVFVSHRGEVCPSGFLPLVAGNVRSRPLLEIYSDSPLLNALRDPKRLVGKCGRCEFAEVCGGSRAQAYARSGNPLGEDPTCAYTPPPKALSASGLVTSKAT